MSPRVSMRSSVDRHFTAEQVFSIDEAARAARGGTGGAFRAGSDIEPPRLLREVKPLYTDKASSPKWRSHSR